MAQEPAKEEVLRRLSTVALELNEEAAVRLKFDLNPAPEARSWFDGQAQERIILRQAMAKLGF